MKKLDIKRALREHNMTQVELCKKTGLLTQNMSPIINGNPTISKLFQIAEGIGCDITDLFYDKNAEKETKVCSESKKEEQVAESEPAYPVHKNGLVAENQQQGELIIPASSMMQAETFCPHCGTRVKLGVVMIQEAK